MPPPLILASTSPYRAAQLRRLGLEFSAEAPGIDENAAAHRGLPPAELAPRLALAKAAAVARRHPQAVVIGGDQVAALGDRIFGKPGSAAAAAAQLSALAGRTHELLTAVAVAHGAATAAALVVCRLTMRDLDPEEIARYVAADRPFDCAGSYKWEQRGPALFAAFAGDDPSAIEGLPLMALARLLRAAGIPLP